MTDARTKKIGFGKRLLTAAASLVMLATCAVTAMPAHAENGTVNGGTFTFSKYLVMNQDANVPNVDFEFEIAPGQAVDSDGNNPAIKAGIGSPSVRKVSFTAADTQSAKNGKPTDTEESGVSSGYKYATKTVTVDLSNVTFSAPGIYRYIIEEKASTASGIANDQTPTRTLDAYVSYVKDEDTQLLTNQLKVEYVMYSGTLTVNTGLNTGKSDNFTNSYATQNLTLAKEVTGNQGDRDKYFEFKVNITSATPGTVYTVDVTTDAEAKPSVDGVVKTNQATLTADDDGNVVDAVYYLKDGQSIVIKGLTENTNYNITETDYSTDGYTTTNTDNTAGGKTTGDKTMGTSAHTVTFTNHKEGTVPTGILLDVAPYIVLVALVGVGLIALLATKKRRSR